MKTKPATFQFKRKLKKPFHVRALQWLKHGDHPDVVPCPLAICGHKDKKAPHGLIRFDTNLFAHVFPGNWIVYDQTGISVLKDKTFKNSFEPLAE